MLQGGSSGMGWCVPVDGDGLSASMWVGKSVSVAVPVPVRGVSQVTQSLPGSSHAYPVLPRHDCNCSTVSLLYSCSVYPDIIYATGTGREGEGGLFLKKWFGHVPECRA